MFPGTSRHPIGILALALVFAISATPALSQADTNPDSPNPVLISENGSTRALTSLVRRSGRETRGLARSMVFRAGSTATVFVTNLALADGEGANAFRVWAEDSKGRVYRFPVTDLRPVAGREWVYALTFMVRDEIGYHPEPTRGDILIDVSWRGMASNRVRLAYGAVGGSIKDDAGARPTPLPDSPPAPTAEAESLIGEYRWSRDATRFLQQSTFGPNTFNEERLRTLGLRGWLNEQFKKDYSDYLASYPSLALKSLDSGQVMTNPVTSPGGGCRVNNTDGTFFTDSGCIRDYYTQYQLQTWFYRQALYGDQQLRHRVAWALSQIWVTSGIENNQASWMIEYHQVLSKHAFGNWRDLMYDMTLNPAMGNYLDMIRSTRNSPNENYAREVLQLFNVGLFLLNQDGTVIRDSNGDPVDTYSQATVDNFTKVFTGWTLCENASICPNRTNGSPNYKDPMVVATQVNSGTQNHDLTAKTLMDYPGATTRDIAACTGCTGTNAINYARNSLNQALDNIYYHPNTAPFVSKLLIQSMVTSDPTPAYVERVTNVFVANRTNPTQMKEVIRAILLDPEARGSVKTDPRYGKLREPVLLTANLMRQFDVMGVNPVNQSDGNINTLNSGIGQNAFNPMSVFNYYPFDYMVPGTTLPGPQFGIYTTGTSIGRMNSINTMVFSQLNVNTSNNGNYAPFGTKLQFTEAQNISISDPTGNRLVDYLNAKMMHGSMSPEMRQSILTAVNAIGTTTANHLTRAQTAVYLIATSSQYQVQR